MEMADKPWESRTVEQDIKSEDEEAIKTVQVDMGIQKPCPNSQSPTLCEPDRAYPAPGSHHSPEKIFVPSLHCSASPRSCGRHLNFNEEPQTPEKLGSRCSSIFDDFNCMAATESASARACPRRQRPQTPETEGRSSVKRRLIFHAVETSSVASPTMPQRSPSLKGSSLIRGIPGPIMTERSNMSFTGTGSNKRDETKPSSVGDLRKWLR
ncbi:uncharacterized protein LOC131071577 [Cryptomeria japonica]|uniref:uncharacterized protein LOC131071577 n=1 Tax=Cryptomeria japonica TaxID=3369 RepID=UPI0027DA03DE|nr:uncharacterized protein LOC131071577 [Cryptomeria japonica]XP_057863458.2 uncharacterized protein LOC131071577 [Cryptomeria japonica]